MKKRPNKNETNLIDGGENMGNKEKKKVNWKKVMKIALIAFCALVLVVGIGVGTWAYNFVSNAIAKTEGFDLESLESEQASQIYDSEGVLIESSAFINDESGYRVNVEYDDLPQVLVDAIIAAEDSRFFEHNGFDIPRIVKSAISNVMAGEITGGGSTITQQVIKKSFFQETEYQNSYERKVGEIYLAMKITPIVSKEKILESYLNKIYFGASLKAVGIQSSSQYYFGKDVQELTLPEAALLAGTLNAPGAFDPFVNLDSATSRRNTVLQLMFDHGYITQEEMNAAKSIPVENTLDPGHVDVTITNYQAYLDTVYDEVLEKTGYDPRVTSMRIFTYMDRDIQEYLDGIASGELFNFGNEYLECAASVQESMTGRIVGVIGGRDYVTGAGKALGYNRATDLLAQPGSMLKPLLAYGGAYEYLHWSNVHTVSDVPFISGGVEMQNFNRTYAGDMLINEACGNSLNAPALYTYAAVQDKVGRGELVDYMNRFGFDNVTTDDWSVAYTIGAFRTGTNPVTVAGAYAAIANDGIYIEPHTVNYIEIVDTGEIIKIDEQIQGEASRAISSQGAWMIRQTMMNYVNTISNYSPVRYWNLNVCAKTGTSDWDESGYNYGIRPGVAKDGWIAVFTPDYSISVWCGFDAEDIQNVGSLWLWSPLNYHPKTIASMITKEIHGGSLENRYASRPSGITQATIIKGIYPYVSPNEYTPEDRITTGYFFTDNLPSEVGAVTELNGLTSFNASLDALGNLAVKFAEYDPVEMTEESTGTKKYKRANGQELELPYWGDITQIYGRVVYTVEIKDMDGKVLETIKLNTPEATLEYKPTQNVTVTGYYSYELADALRSNSISTNINVGGASTLGSVQYVVSQNGAKVSENQTINAGNINVNITPQSPSNAFSIVLESDGVVVSSSTSSSAVFSVEAGKNYTLIISESDAYTTATKQFKFSTASVETPDPEDPETPEVDPNQGENPQE